MSWRAIGATLLALCLLAGCAQRQALFVVLPNPDGSAGAISIEDGKSSVLLDKPYAAGEVRDGTAKPAEVKPEEVQQLFGRALANQPILPNRFQLYFLPNTTTPLPLSAHTFAVPVLDAIVRISGDGARSGAPSAVGGAGATLPQGLRPLFGEASIQTGVGRRLVALFCYANSRLPALLDALGDEPTLLLASPGPAADGVLAHLGPHLERRNLRALNLPFFDQPGYDDLLRTCDLTFVRGEDSFVRAQWAGRPFCWQLYPQDDGAHRAKLEAFLERFLVDAPAALAAALRRLFRQWNGMAAAEPLIIPPLGPWRAHCERWRDALLVQEDLCTRLVGFVNERR